MKIYGNPGSTCTRRVLMTVAEKGIDADLVVIDFAKGEHKQGPHLQRQPFGKVPALEDDGFWMYESRAMMRYVDELAPTPKLSPTNARDRAKMEQWISVEQSYVSDAAMKIIKEKVFARWRKQPSDMEAVEQGRRELTPALEVLDKALQTSEFVAGPSFSLADITFMPYFEYLFVGDEGELVQAWPNVSNWWNRISARPTWARVTGKAAA